MNNIREEIINFILENNPNLKFKTLEQLSTSALMLIKIQLEIQLGIVEQ